MKIKSLQLKNFKRFTDLTLKDIPDNAKLVLLIGSNGSGKSSVFDGFQVISDLVHRTKVAGSRTFTFSGGKEFLYYHKRPGLLEIDLNFIDNGNISCVFDGINNGKVTANKDFKANLFYGRSAVRYLPRITRTTIGQAIDINQDSDRPEYFIDEDKRFENDIDLLIKEVVEKIFAGINTDSNRQLEEVKFFLNKINEAFPRIFGAGNGTKLSFRRFIPPAEGNPSRLMFDKGISQINYDLLSAGEKEVVNLLFNLFVRNRYFNDTIYFLDEIDTHLNTKLQYALIQEIVNNWIPEKCQLWTASHSLGFIQYAKQSEQGVIFDFDDYDFDEAKILTPVAKENPALYQIAVDDEMLPYLFKDRKIIFVENEDQRYYNIMKMFGVVFMPANNKKTVYHKALQAPNYGLIDRDFLTNSDIVEIESQYKTLKVLRYYSIENYLYHPNNLTEYHQSKNTIFNDQEYIQGIITEKNKIVQHLKIKIASIRQGYPFFGEPEFNGKVNQKKFKPEEENFTQSVEIGLYLESDDFETFYKVFPMKDYATSLPQRQNLSKIELSKTNWFKSQIEKLIQ